MKTGDFSQRKYFPGTNGNPFDVILHRSSELDRIPGFLFILLLGILAIIPNVQDWISAFLLWLFFLGDWVLIGCLPIAKKSFGPVKPVVLVLAVLRMIFAFLPFQVQLPFQIIGTFLVIYGFWIEPHKIQVTHQSLTSSKLPSDFKIKVLHLGDLHIERVTKREENLNQLISELSPDLILFSGDFLNLSYLRDPQSWEAVRKVVSGWKAPFGVYSVSGSPAVDLEDVIPAQIQGLPIQHLNDQRVTLKINNQDIDLIGLTCSHKPHLDYPHLLATLDGSPERFRILLYHSPDLAPQAAGSNIDLQLSGHTHGGQVRIPFVGALFTGSLYGKTFEAGRMQIDELVLYITRGIGLEGAGAPRVRFLCPPEIILWDISGSK